MLTLLLILACPALCAAQAKPDGPAPRAADGKADLSGVWNKNLVQNTAKAV